MSELSDPERVEGAELSEPLELNEQSELNEASEPSALRAEC